VAFRARVMRAFAVGAIMLQERMAAAIADVGASADLPSSPSTRKDCTCAMNLA